MKFAGNIIQTLLSDNFSATRKNLPTSTLKSMMLFTLPEGMEPFGTFMKIKSSMKSPERSTKKEELLLQCAMDQLLFAT